MAIFRFVAFVLFAIGISGVSVAQDHEAEPLLVLIETDPWLMVIGSDSPRFAVYKNGDVIYRDGKGYRSVHLEKAEFDGLVASMNLAAVAKHSGQFETTDASDQPSEIFLGFDQETPWALFVYGRIRPGAGKDVVPPDVVNLYQHIESFANDRSTEWVPDKFEVMIWPYEYAPDASIQWPKDWPGLDDPATRQRGDAYSLFLPSALYSQFRSLLETRRQKGAVKIGGKKWAVSYRFPFPAEDRWMDSQ